MKSTELGLKKLMVWLTILLLVSGALFGAGAGLVVGDPEVQKAIREAQEQQKLNNPGY
ncbi:hypothetical protein [Roseimicrobium gellanilyticum]|nr:hypothetical protein [Roseimicrobium gellanilyticum]